MIPYGRQNINQEDIDAVLNVLKSDFLTQGPKVPYFEEIIANQVTSKHAVAVNSATSALHIACMALGLKRGDLLWTTPNTFVASANAGLYCGADVDFVDIDPKTYNMCPRELEKKFKIAKKNNRLPKILIPVHLCGQSCDMKTISRLCKQYEVKIIEDASHAIGGSYFGQPIGSCKYSDITVFSFHPVKIITTGEGGIAVTNNKSLAQKLSALRTHGITRDQKLMTERSHGDWYYQQIMLGYNYRMTDLQAALGISQMQRLDEFIEKRHKIAKRYNELLKDLPIELPFQEPEVYSSFHLYVIRLKLNQIDSTHKNVFNTLREKGVGVNIHYIPVHTHPYYKNIGFKEGDFPEAEKYYREAISLPMYPDLSKKDQDKVVKILESLI